MKIKETVNIRRGTNVPTPNNEIEIVNHMHLPDIMHIANLYNETRNSSRAKYGISHTPKNKGLNTLKKLGKGSYGTVFEYKKFAIKYIENPKDPKNNDAEVLKAICHLDCIPTLYAVIDKQVLIMEKIVGETVESYVDNRLHNPLGIDESIITHWEEILADVVRAGYSPDDAHEANVMIEHSTGKLKLIDVGWFFPHNNNHEDNIDSIRSDYGYGRADSWTGSRLRGYIGHLRRKEELRKVIERQALAC